MTAREAENDETRGLSLRELVLELRNDVKSLTGRVSSLETSGTVHNAGALALLRAFGILRATVLFALAVVGAIFTVLGVFHP